MRKYMLLTILIGVVFTYFIAARVAHRVSNEIKDSFDKVNNSITQSNYSISAHNYQHNSYFELKLALDPEHAAQLYRLNIAIEGERYYLDSLKGAFEAKFTSHDDLTASEQFFITERNGIALYERMLATNAVLLQLALEDSTRQKIERVSKSLESDGSGQVFAEKYFKMTPHIAALTILSKFQNDLHNLEMVILEDYSNLAKNSKAKQK